MYSTKCTIHPGIKFVVLKHCRYFTEILYELLLFQRAKTNIIDKIMISSKICKLLELPTYSKRPKNSGYSLKTGHFQIVLVKPTRSPQQQQQLPKFSSLLCSDQLAHLGSAKIITN